jgi:hypothetical protein
LKKAAQKLSGIRAGGVGSQTPPARFKKSFLLLFYKKAGLPLLTSCAIPEGSGIMSKLSFYGQNHPKNCVDLVSRLCRAAAYAIGAGCCARRGVALKQNPRRV